MEEHVDISFEAMLKEIELMNKETREVVDKEEPVCVTVEEQALQNPMILQKVIAYLVGSKVPLKTLRRVGKAWNNLILEKLDGNVQLQLGKWAPCHQLVNVGPDTFPPQLVKNVTVNPACICARKEGGWSTACVLTQDQTYYFNFKAFFMTYGAIIAKIEATQTDPAGGGDIMLNLLLEMPFPNLESLQITAVNYGNFSPRPSHNFPNLQVLQLQCATGMIPFTTFQCIIDNAPNIKMLVIPKYFYPELHHYPNLEIVANKIGPPFGRARLHVTDLSLIEHDFPTTLPLQMLQVTKMLRQVSGTVKYVQLDLDSITDFAQRGPPAYLAPLDFPLLEAVHIKTAGLLPKQLMLAHMPNLQTLILQNGIRFNLREAMGQLRPNPGLKVLAIPDVAHIGILRKIATAFPNLEKLYVKLPSLLNNTHQTLVEVFNLVSLLTKLKVVEVDVYFSFPWSQLINGIERAVRRTDCLTWLKICCVPPIAMSMDDIGPAELQRLLNSLLYFEQGRKLVFINCQMRCATTGKLVLFAQRQGLGLEFY